MKKKKIVSTVADNSPAAFEEMFLLILAGGSAREISPMVGIQKNTIGKYRTIIAKAHRELGLGEILCPCGLPSVHSSWCNFRWDHSPARRKTHPRPAELNPVP